MILTCPECATSYFVDDTRIPARGRMVKCTTCGAKWLATREDERPPEPDLFEAPAPAPVPAPKPEDDLEFVSVEPPPVEETPFAPPPSRKRAREGEARSKVMVFASAAVVVVAVVSAAIVFRAQVVRMWPKTSIAYAGLGLPVNKLGLVIENVHVAPTFQGGRPVLSVTGSIRNVKDEAVDSPALRLSLLNRAGKPVTAKVAKPIDPRVPARSVRHFAIAIADPPANARDLEVAFDAAQAAQETSTTLPISALGTPRAVPPAEAQPTEAQPLPAGAPDALPQHG